jgi:hypothetical protein
MINEMLKKGDKPKNVCSYIVIYAKEKHPNDPNWEQNIPTLQQVPSIALCLGIDT